MTASAVGGGGSGEKEAFGRRAGVHGSPHEVPDLGESLPLVDEDRLLVAEQAPGIGFGEG